MEPLGVVIDTSSLVSYILTKGDIMNQIMTAWRENEFILLTSPETRAELTDVLSRPEIQELSAALLKPFANGIEKFSFHVPGFLKIRGGSRDPKDDKFLACAVEGKAHYLVSSDEDLLDIGQFKQVCILNPGQFLAALHLAKLSVEDIKAQYSLEALNRILSELCLQANTREKLRKIVSH